MEPKNASTGDASSDDSPFLPAPPGQGAAAEIRYYHSVVVAIPPDPGENTLPAPAKVQKLDPLGNADGEFTAPMPGWRLTHRQAWSLQGLALGNLVGSVALAPGEACRIASSSWQGSYRGTGLDAAEQTDSLSSTQSAIRNVQEVSNTVMQQVQQGASRARSKSSSSQGALAPVSLWNANAATGSNTTTTTTATFSSGSQNLAAHASQTVDAATQAAASALRAAKAATVREVSEADASQATTRIVANYNRQYPMTVMYFEIIENYQVETRLDHAERVLLVPMKVTRFSSLSKEVLRKYAEVLASAARAAGMDALADSLGRDDLAAGGSSAASPVNLQTDLQKAREKQAQAECALEQATEKVSRARENVAPGEKTLSDLMTYQQALMAQGHFGAKLQEANKAIITATASLAQPRANLETATSDRTEAMARVKQATEAVRELQVRAVDLANVLDRHGLYFNQAIWLSLEAGAILHLLRTQGAGYEALQIEPRSLGVFHNCLVLPWPVKSGEKAEPFYNGTTIELPKGPLTSSQIALPTGAVYAEAVLGRSNAAEKRDETRYTNWTQPPLAPPEIAPVSTDSRYRELKLEPGAVGASAVTLPQPIVLPDPTKLGEVVSAFSTASIFRDMSGISVAGDLAKMSVQYSAQGASDAADKAEKAMEKLVDAGVKAMELYAAFKSPNGAAAPLGNNPEKPGSPGRTGGNGESPENSGGEGNSTGQKPDQPSDSPGAAEPPSRPGQSAS